MKIVDWSSGAVNVGAVVFVAVKSVASRTSALDCTCSMARGVPSKMSRILLCSDVGATRADLASTVACSVVVGCGALPSREGGTPFVWGDVIVTGAAAAAALGA